MDATPHTAADRMIVDLDEAECLRLAATEPVGRVAWNGADGPAVVPVNFTLEDGQVHVRTAPYSALTRECDDSRVAFEVDAYDADNRLGWSVVLAGRARVGFAEAGTPAPQVWPVGAKAAHLTITVDRVTGRRLKPR
jgi:nitroimidazol reductase NimA-like FMN-containing flavoprotein (pyridoxamine 5'-phosphate oxidase superfamily)